MNENCDLRTDSNHKISLTKTKKFLLPGIINFINVAVCPKCGEISLYVDPNKVEQK